MKSTSNVAQLILRESSIPEDCRIPLYQEIDYINVAARQEGWEIFDCGGEWKITAKLKGQFAHNDARALVHIRNLARQGSRLHERALEMTKDKGFGS